jgi:hemoglobin-like flavoprotein
VADGAGNEARIEARLETLAKAVMKQTEQIAGMSAEMRSFMSKELAAHHRLENRVETEAIIGKALDNAMQTVAADRKAEIAQMRAEVMGYADAKVKELEARLAAQEDRDKKREGEIQRQQLAMGGMVLVIIAYAIVQALGGG